MFLMFIEIDDNSVMESEMHTGEGWGCSSVFLYEGAQCQG